MALPRVSVHSSGRFLQREDGSPFFWLGDTAWELFHRLTLAETEHYLEVRRRQGFNVIQAVVLAELDGLRTPNANGHVPLLGDDPTRPNEFYFRHVDAVVRLAASKGLYVGLLPTWGDKVDGTRWGLGPVVFNRDNARWYGEFLGRRYKDDPNVIWILGGDRPAEGCEDVWDAMAQGIIEGLGFVPLMSYHPSGGSSSSKWLHAKPWLGLNMFQSGHTLVDAPNWEVVAADYALEPAKPVIDGEPNYEHHPIDPYLREWKPEYGRYTDYDVRKQAYRAVFAGACGHTYGSHSVWQFWSTNRAPTTFPSPTWEEAIHGPGAGQLVHLSNLIQQYPYYSRIPDQSLLIGQAGPQPVTDPQGQKVDPLRAEYAVATRDREGSYALIYCPVAAKPIGLNLSSLRLPVQGYWFDPRSGLRHFIGEFREADAALTTPLGGPDWVLVFEAG